MSLHDPDLNAAPFNPVPPIIVVIACVIGGVEALFQLAEAGIIGGQTGVGWRLWAYNTFGFYDPLFERMLALGDIRGETLWRFVTYSFVHASIAHSLFAVVIILAIGNKTARVFSPLAVVVVMVAGAIMGALVYGLAFDTEVRLIGAFPAAYALLGLFTWLLWLFPDPDGPGRIAAFRLIGVLIAIQIVFAALLGGGWANILADVAGFAAGFGLAFLLAPDGGARMRGWLDRMRDRE